LHFVILYVLLYPVLLNRIRIVSNQDSRRRLFASVSISLWLSDVL